MLEDEVMEINLRCPFCDHPILSKKQICGNCRKKIDPLYFNDITCYKCGEVAKISKGLCSKCGNRINVFEIEVGKYIEIPKRRRLNLVSEREEKTYQKMKFELLGAGAEEEIEIYKQSSVKSRKIYLRYLLVSMVLYWIVGLIYASIKIINTGSPAFEVFKKNITPSKFIISLSLFLIIKAIIFTAIFFISKKRPIYSYLASLIMAVFFLVFEFVFEAFSLPDTPSLYYVTIVIISSDIFVFLLTAIGIKFALNFEDYSSHFA